MRPKNLLSRYSIEQEEDWRGWIDKIPFIKFPRSWMVQVIPPFAGALVRFRIKRKDSKHFVSVYLDGFENLGFHAGTPYWEVYPIGGDVEKCDMNDTKKLLRLIQVASAEPLNSGHLG